LNKRHFSVRHAASTDETRYNLNSILLEPDGTTVASDGYMLIRCKAFRGAADQFPAVEHPPSDEIPLTRQIALQREDVEALVKSIPKGRPVSNCDILGNAALDVASANDNPTVRFTTTDLERKSVHEVRKLDGEYPQYRQVIPEGKPVARFAIDLNLLARVGKALSDFHPNEKMRSSQAVVVELFSEHAPVRITSQWHPSSDEDSFEAFVMPMRCENPIVPAAKRKAKGEGKAKGSRKGKTPEAYLIAKSSPSSILRWRKVFERDATVLGIISRRGTLIAMRSEAEAVEIRDAFKRIVGDKPAEKIVAQIDGKIGAKSEASV